MKKAEEILSKHIDKESMDDLSVNVWPDMIDAMKEYAKKAFKEQRKLCEKAWLDENVNNSSNHVKMMAIRNAPEPPLD